MVLYFLRADNRCPGDVHPAHPCQRIYRVMMHTHYSDLPVGAVRSRRAFFTFPFKRLILGQYVVA